LETVDHVIVGIAAALRETARQAKEELAVHVVVLGRRRLRRGDREGRAETKGPRRIGDLRLGWLESYRLRGAQKGIAFGAIAPPFDQAPSAGFRSL
jgi:hypothetical protein